MSKDQLICNIKEEIQTIDAYVDSYENVKLPSGRQCKVSLNTFQAKLGMLANECFELHSMYPEICSVRIYNTLKNIQLEDIPQARYKCFDTESEYEQTRSIWHEVKPLLEPIINN